MVTKTGCVNVCVCAHECVFKWRIGVEIKKDGGKAIKERTLGNKKGIYEMEKRWALEKVKLHIQPQRTKKIRLCCESKVSTVSGKQCMTSPCRTRMCRLLIISAYCHISFPPWMFVFISLKYFDFFMNAQGFYFISNSDTPHMLYFKSM